MLTKTFKQLKKSDTGIAGGKGASLGELTQVGIPVPSGFVLLTEAFEDFLDQTDLKQDIRSELNKVDSDKVHTVETASENIQSLILHAKIPFAIQEKIETEFKKLNAKFVAVRSSATAEDGLDHAWAGQLDSFLNVTQDNLIESVQKCWASLFTPRAIFYRFEKGLEDSHISVAVVIQSMVNSDKSGIAFSVHPVTEDENQMIIEAGFGLGEAIVSGSITPDAYVVSKKDNTLIDTNINNQTKAMYRKKDGGNKWIDLEEKGKEQVLNEKEILELASLIKKIEDHYGLPQDIEWAQESGIFYITQSRPITTLKNKAKKKKFNALKLDQYKLIKQIEYPKTPVIFYESGHYCYVDNPFLKKLNIKKYPVSVAIQDKIYENWSDENTAKITSKKEIDFIIKESLSIINKYKNTITQYSDYNYSDLDNKKIILILNELDKILKEIYQIYIFFIDEYFDTKIKNLLLKLPEVRIKLSDFVGLIQDNVLSSILKEIKDRFDNKLNLSLDNAHFDEIISLLQNPKKIKTFDQIQNRAIAFVGLKQKLLVLTGQEALQLKDDIQTIKKQKNADDLLRGQTVFEGNTQGIIKKVSVLDYENLRKVQWPKNNFVLAVPMTRTEIVPYLKKCIAIITDEGGITCHAAIVARELKIPCIVGTKIATKVLHDGTLVEVDADEGIVRVLDKKNKTSHSSKDWVILRNREIPSIWPTISFWDWDINKIIGNREWSIYYVWDNGDFTGIVEKTLFPLIGKYYYKKLLSVGKNLDAIRKKSTTIGNRIIKLCQNFEKDLSQHKNSDFIAFLQKLRKEYGQFAKENMFYWLTDSKEIKNELDVHLKKYTEKEQKIIWKTMLVLDEMSYAKKIELELNKLKKSYRTKKPSIFQKELNLFVKKYIWFPYEYTGPRIYDKKTVLDIIKNEKIDKIEHINQKNKIIKKYKLSNKIIKLFKMINFLSILQDDRKMFNSQICYYSNELILPALAKKLNIPKKLIKYADNKLLEKYSTNKKELTRILKERNRFFVIEQNNKKQTYFTTKGKEYLKSKSIILKEKIKNTKIIKGDIAQSGRTKGIARIIKNSGTVKNFGEGDILIAPMTTPDYIHLMKKASAIITDEGGITCHAAIISRELKIPCLIGTKIATKVLHDGDLIKVDADNGIVKILS